MGSLCQLCRIVLSDLAEMALSVLEEPSVPHTVERVLEFALAAVDCAHAAMVFVHSKQRLETVAATDSAIGELIAKQMELQEGPVLSVLHDGHSVIVDDTHTEARWPRWASTAAAVGLRSTLVVRLFTSDRTIGTLKSVRLPRRPLLDSPTCRWPISWLATRRSRCHGFRTKTISAEQSTPARLIGQAQGIFMERNALDAHQALQALRRYFQHGNMSCATSPTRLVDTRRCRTPRPHPDRASGRPADHYG